jgi:hypothetical protein
MKKKLVRLLVEILVAFLLGIIGTGIYLGAVLQESYKITPLTSAEMEK